MGFICPVSARVNSRSLINTIVSAILPSGPEPRHLVVSGVNVKCFCCRRMVSEERWTSGEHRRQCAINKSVRMNLNLQVLYRSVARLSKGVNFHYTCIFTQKTLHQKSALRRDIMRLLQQEQAQAVDQGVGHVEF